jgi:hypothetical protein
LFLFQDTCQISSLFSNSITYCSGDYNILNDDKSDYDFTWSPLLGPSSAVSSNFLDVSNAFKYTKSLSISSYPMSGVYTEYLGGGYVYKMNGNASEILGNFTFLEQNNWIDRQTRAVFLEFNVYNPNIKMFAYCYVLFEFLPIGTIVKSYRFSPMTLFDDRTSLYSFGTVCAVIYMVMICILTMKQIYCIKVHKMRYFKRMWTYLDLTLIAFSFAAFSIWLYRVWEALSIMEKLSTKKKMVNLQMLAYWDDILASMLAFCTSLGSLKFFRILQFNRSIQTLAKAFEIGFGKIAGFIFIFALLCFSWLQIGYVIFSDRIIGFSTFVKTIETGFLLLLGKFQLEEMMQANPFWTILFHSTFNICMVFILLQLFLTLIGHSLSEAKKDERKSDPLQMEDFIYQKLASVFEKLKNKLINENDQSELKDHERKMKESLAQKDLYRDATDLFASKTDQIILRFEEFQSHYPKDSKTQKSDKSQWLFNICYI